MNCISDVLFYVLIMFILPLLEKAAASRRLLCQLDLTQRSMSNI